MKGVSYVRSLCVEQKPMIDGDYAFRPSQKEKMLVPSAVCMLPWHLIISHFLNIRRLRSCENSGYGSAKVTGGRTVQEDDRATSGLNRTVHMRRMRRS